MAMFNGQQVVEIRNTFLHCDASPSSGRFRSASQEPPSGCDRFALSVHALMYSPKKQPTIIGKEHKALVESRSAAQWPLPELLEDSTSADSDAEDVGSEVSRTTSAARSSGSEVANAKPHGVSATCDEEEEGDLAASGEHGIEALLEREGMEALKKQVPMDVHGNPCSVGSIPHAAGACKPCVFANSERKVCQNGLECLFCHLPHAPKKRMRFCKKKRLEIKRTGSGGNDKYATA
eukprot:gnl/MRDRNA2_/MRDRNA2_93708_c0_seq1.p1 gnl/MRDRNA2_/MRDRNA2_93708_c0~~gnl/MRDRNA2_/MRDRNA2_93708_c0_seq1.p1  ORF type:complete len:235 (+),score=56.50 gnl/MRDRNA2_/MRDRNA2_93708_c0_seq1:79-783(+)